MEQISRDDIEGEKSEVPSSFMVAAVSSWTGLARLMILVGGTLVIIFFALYLLIKASVPSGLNLSVSGTTIKIGSNGTLDTILVHPRGWTDSNIDVEKGDQIIVDATGSINVAMGHMLNGLSSFVTTADTKPDRNVELFTKEEIEESLIPFPWNGPSGVDVKEIRDVAVLNRIRTALKKFIYPNGEVGQLLMYVSSNGSCPTVKAHTEIKSIFPYHGPNTTNITNKSGRLCFVINDVITEKPEPRILNWQDNIGYYSVRVRVEPKTEAWF